MLRHLTAACLAALLALYAASPRAGAKPPDLPDDEPVIVAAPDAAAALVEAYLLTADPLVEICREDEPEVLTTMPKEESACPFCAAPADRRALTAADLKGMPSVMDNLRALQKAAAEIDRARELGAEGNFTEAIGHLDIARKLCPGSTYVRRAEEVMGEIFGVTTGIGDAETQEVPCCPEGCCEPLTRIRNVGACYMAQLGCYCEKVQAAAKAGCCARCGEACGCNPACACESACPRPETKHARVVIIFGASSDGGLIGSIVLNEGNFDSEQTCPAACYKACGSACSECKPARTKCVSACSKCESASKCKSACTKCESACPKCEKMHQAVMEKAERKAAGVKEQVDGLLKACYFAVREGRHAKAADLARQAHALDPKRVEADPLAYKLHVLAGSGQCEECEPTPESHPACPKAPTDPVEDNVSLRPTLPAVDPDVVPALDHVLMKHWIDEDGLERVGVEFIDAPKDCERECRDVKAAGCPCLEVIKSVGRACAGMLFTPTRMDAEKGYVALGLGTHGVNVNVSFLSKYAGMKILWQYRDGLPLVWLAADTDGAETH